MADQVVSATASQRPGNEDASRGPDCAGRPGAEIERRTASSSGAARRAARVHVTEERAMDERDSSRLIGVTRVASPVVLGFAVLLLAPELAAAALRTAAGGGGGDAGGFERFVVFLNRLADYAIPVGAAFSVLGLIWGGMLFQAGDARAGRVLGFVVLGVAVVLLSKPIAA
jgi:hypothetical protein